MGRSDERMQRAELRVTFEGAEGCALVLFVEVRGRDIYAGQSKASSARYFRASYHETGKRHMHTKVGRFSRRDDIPPEEIRGFREILQVTTAADDWAYVPKTDTERKRTLRLHEADYPDGACVMAVAVSPERTELIEAFRTGAIFEPVKVDLGAALVADWVAPVVVLVAVKMRPSTVAAIRASVAKDGGDPDEKLNGFILGPPAPNGIVWTTLGKVAADGTVTQFAPTDS